jgi:hypothetical protein
MVIEWVLILTLSSYHGAGGIAAITFESKAECLSAANAWLKQRTATDVYQNALCAQRTVSK